MNPQNRSVRRYQNCSSHVALVTVENGERIHEDWRLSLAALPALGPPLPVPGSPPPEDRRETGHPPPHPTRLRVPH
ncbi:hypothetical protein CEXT_327431 [Caerostris extrusa]|uniref:Uncharacterized protein n=1 Tax=Caerostris extrusa TaxID=172846 RepID=A0AAV4XFG8_CAEEX|nr:hypothetical protein CEXT_327431 [Caerostris extrusa]